MTSCSLETYCGSARCPQVRLTGASVSAGLLPVAWTQAASSAAAGRAAVVRAGARRVPVAGVMDDLASEPGREPGYRRRETPVRLLCVLTGALSRWERARRISLSRISV